MPRPDNSPADSGVDHVSPHFVFSLLRTNAVASFRTSESRTGRPTLALYHLVRDILCIIKFAPRACSPFPRRPDIGAACPVNMLSRL